MPNNDERKVILITRLIHRTPEEIPPDLDPLERAMIAAANIRLWADFLLETGPAPEKSDTLTDASGDGSP